MKEICNACNKVLEVSPADYMIRHLVCKNTICRNYGLLVAYPKPEADTEVTTAVNGTAQTPEKA